MIRARYLAVIALPLATPLAAQDHDHGDMDHSAHTAPEAEPITDEHDHDAMDQIPIDQGPIDHAAMGHAMAAPVANAPPPARAHTGPRHAADAIWGADPMQPSRIALARENGAMQTGSLMVERLEARLGSHDAFLWDVQAFWGGDLDRIVIKSEGEGSFSGGTIENADIQALWSHAIGPFTDLQAGARLDLEPGSRVHGALGLQGLAPYMLHYDVAAFLSDTGDLTARIEAEYDQKITQSLILQPRIELDLAAQDIPERGVGAGLSSVETGLRLRYEITREFAPYLGVEWERMLGVSADFARSAGEDPSSVVVLLGLRSWF